MKLSKLNIHSSVNTPIARGMDSSLAVQAAHGYDIEVTPLGVIISGEKMLDGPAWIPLERCVGGTVLVESEAQRRKPKEPRAEA